MSTIELAKRYASLTFDELPPEVVGKAKNFVLDTVGVAAAGVGLASSRLLLEWASEVGGNAQSTIISGPRVPASQAAFVNSTIAHGVELDDVDNASSLHPGVVAIPTALAVAESTGSSGEEVITAVVAGYDAIIRIGRATGPSEQYARGFHPTATCGAFAAAVTAGRLMGLGPAETANAIGIAGSFAAGNLEYLSNGAWTKRLQVGGAARAGVISAQLAARGYTGPTTILEGANGFLQAHSASPDPERLTEGLLDVSVKPFACCRYCQTPIDAVLELVEQNQLDPQLVTSVDIGMVSAGIPIVAEPRDHKLDPQNSVDAQFSVYYAVAVALARGAAFLKEFDDVAVRDPDVRRLLPLVHAHADPSLDESYPERWPSIVTITMESGKRFELLAKSCRGDPDKPLAHEELREKFSILAGESLAPASLSSLGERIEGLESEPNVDAMMALLGEAGRWI